MSETQQLKISTLAVKTVTTKYGPKEKWSVNGKWESFKGEWNKDWTIGGYAKGIFETKQNGQYTNHNINIPPELRQQGGGFSMQMLKEIKEEVVAVHMLLADHFGKDVPAALTASPEPITTPAADPEPIEEKGVEEEINIESIPLE